MTERPILFSAPMVRAILAGTKTQTRRLISPRPTVEPDGLVGHPRLGGFFAEHVFGSCMAQLVPCPYGALGDRLWVREAFAYSVKDPDLHHEDGDHSEEAHDIVYRATAENTGAWTRHEPDGSTKTIAPPWRPGIHMPRWASRITLAVTDVRVQRVQEISEADILAEGCAVDAVAKMTGTPWSDMPTLHHAWRVAWDHINYQRAPWESDPWVWAISFEVVK